MNFREMSDNQRRVFIDAAQIYEAYREAYWQNVSCRGSMFWKTDREPLKKKRDFNQSEVVAHLIMQYLPE